MKMTSRQSSKRVQQLSLARGKGKLVMDYPVKCPREAHLNVSCRWETIDPQNHGFCSSLLLKCCLCKDDKYRRNVYTSTRLRDESRNDVAFDVNIRMVLLAHELGLGYAALRKISKVLGLPGLHLKTYQRHGDVWLLPPCNIL